jgi:type II secretory pathway predicted ATPase ExeA
MTTQLDPQSIGLISALRSMRAGKEPFRPISLFIQTRFAQRLLEVLELALETGQWFVVCAQSGDGKSVTLRKFERQHPRHRNDHGAMQVPVLATRVPKTSSPNALMFALASSLGAVPGFSVGRFRQWFVHACVVANVRLIVIDDAHELSAEQLDYLRELTDHLADRGHGVALVLLAALKSTIAAEQPVWKLIRRNALTAWQFDRRTDATDPLVLIASLSEDEVREVLRTFETAYRPTFPSLRLARWAGSLFRWLLDERIDRAHTKRVRMDSVCQVVYAALREAHIRDIEDLGPDARLLHEACIRLAVRGVTYTFLEAEKAKAKLPAAANTAEADPEGEQAA